MTKEEIAKDLTIVIINKMPNPTADNVSDTYRAMLQKISESQQVATLQTIEDHLTKQDENSIQHVWIAMIAFAASIAVAGVTLVLTASTLTGDPAAQLRSSGYGVMIYGLVLVIVLAILAKASKKKKGLRRKCLPPNGV